MQKEHRQRSLNASWRTGLAAVLVMALVAGCGGASKPQSSSEPTKPSGGEVKPAAPAAPVVTGGKIVLYDPRQNKSNTEAVQAVIKEFTQKTGIEVETVVNDTGKHFLEKLRIMLAAGTPPDVWFQDSTVPAYVAEGIPEPLDNYINRDKVDISHINKSALGFHTFQGKLYTIPVANYIQLMVYNPDLFDAAGVPHPPDKWGDPTWTMDELINRAKKLTKYEGGKIVQAGITNLHQLWLPGLYNQGHVTPDGKAYNSDNPDFIKMLKLAYDVHHTVKVQPFGANLKELQKAVGVNNIFMGGKTAMNIISSGEFAGYIKQDKVKWKLAPMPKAASSWIYQSPGGYAMVAGSKEKERAWQFLKWVSDPDVMYKLAKAYGRPPVSDKAMATWVKEQEALKPGVGWNLVLQGMVGHGMPAQTIQYVTNPKFRDLHTKVWVPAIDRIVNKKESADAVARWMKEEGDKILQAK